MPDISTLFLQIFNCFFQARNRIVKFTQSQIAMLAEQTANSFCFVAMVNNQRRFKSMFGLANKTSIVLLLQKLLILFISNAVKPFAVHYSAFIFWVSFLFGGVKPFFSFRRGNLVAVALPPPCPYHFGIFAHLPFFVCLSFFTNAVFKVVNLNTCFAISGNTAAPIFIFGKFNVWFCFFASETKLLFNGYGHFVFAPIENNLAEA